MLVYLSYCGMIRMQSSFFFLLHEEQRQTSSLLDVLKCRMLGAGVHSLNNTYACDLAHVCVSCLFMVA